MTRLKPKGSHPRKPTWALFRCSICHDDFWGPDDMEPDLTVRFCRHCANEHKAPPRGVSSPADRNYHGGQFNKGEW